MTDGQQPAGIVTETIRGLLPTVNAGFNWEVVKRRYDNNPVGTAMSLHFTGERGDEPVEEIFLGVAEGPEIVILDEITGDWNYLGSIVTYQDFGLRILDPDDPMTADDARYVYRSVDINAAEGRSRERTWLVVSNVLDTMLESVIYEAGNGDDAADDATGQGGTDTDDATAADIDATTGE